MGYRCPSGAVGARAPSPSKEANGFGRLPRGGSARLGSTEAAILEGAGLKPMRVMLFLITRSAFLRFCSLVALSHVARHRIASPGTVLRSSVHSQAIACMPCNCMLQHFSVCSSSVTPILLYPVFDSTVCTTTHHAI